MPPIFRRSNSLEHGRHGAGSRGFTLIELVVVMLILAVSAVLVVPSVTSGRRQREVRHTLQAVQAIVRRAAQTAVFRRRRVELRLDAEAGRVALTAPRRPSDTSEQQNPPAGAPSADDGKEDREVVQELVLPPTASLDDFSGGRFENDTLVIEFFPTGGSSGGGFGLRFADHPSGRVRQAFAIAIDPLTSELALEEAR